MCNVIIISTEHRENGKCNSEELLSILEQIKPEVIFEEEPNDDKYHSYYTDPNSFKSLEVNTILKYREKNFIVNVPVDKPINEFASLYLLDCFTKMFMQYQEYASLIREHCTFRNREGFAYLNSKECSVRNENKLMLEKQILIKRTSSASELQDLYNQFQEEVDARERSMIENISEFARINKFGKAAFLLGYAHRESIRLKISTYKYLTGSKIDWKLYNE